LVFVASLRVLDIWLEFDEKRPVYGIGKLGK
jgi:hypothetical protein